MQEKPAKTKLSEIPFQRNLGLMHYLDLCVDICAICDTKGQILYLNPTFCKITGSTIDDVGGKKFSQFAHSEDRSDVESILENFLKTKQSVDKLRHRYVVKDCTVIYLSWSLVYDELENLVYLTARDITELHKEKEKLRFFSTAFDRATDAIIIAENNGTLKNPIPSIIYANQTFLNYSGYNLEEVLGKNPKLMRGNNSNQQVIDKMRHALKHWLPLSIEILNKTKDGQDIWVDLSISPIANEEGSFTHWISIQRDITEQVRREEKLRMFQSVVTNSKDSVIITDAKSDNTLGQFKIVYVNDAFTTLTGYSKEDVMGRSPNMFQGLETSNEAKANIRNAILKWQPIQQDILNYRKNGEKFWVNLSIVPIIDEKGSFTHWLSIQREVTDRIKLQEELEAKVEERTHALERSNQRLEDFASVASHDLRAPLRMINSYLDLTKRRVGKKLGAEQLALLKEELEFLEFAQKGAVDAYELVQGILAYSHIKSGEYAWETVDLNKKINNVSLILKKDIELANATINYENLPKIRGNKIQIQQLFQNLIGNALKFRDKPVCEITITHKVLEDGYLIAIKDNGIGMSEQDMKIIFNLMGRGKTTKSYEGYGIGLSVCKEIVKNHNGDIWVDSVLGEGTTFYFTLKT